jgi:hypothetical protein
VQEDQVQGGEALLAVDEEAPVAVLVGVDERAEEVLHRRRPAGPARAARPLELADEIGDQGRDLVRAPGVLPLVVLDRIGHTAVEQSLEGESLASDPAARHPPRPDGC